MIVNQSLIAIALRYVLIRSLLTLTTAQPCVAMRNEWATSATSMTSTTSVLGNERQMRVQGNGKGTAESGTSTTLLDKAKIKVDVGSRMGGIWIELAIQPRVGWGEADFEASGRLQQATENILSQHLSLIFDSNSHLRKVVKKPRISRVIHYLKSVALRQCKRILLDIWLHSSINVLQRQ